MAAATGWRDRDVFSRWSRVSALFSALPAISAERHYIHSTGKKVPATFNTVWHRYFSPLYRYPHGTVVPVWTPTCVLRFSPPVKTDLAPIWQKKCRKIKFKIQQDLSHIYDTNLSSVDLWPFRPCHRGELWSPYCGAAALYSQLSSCPGSGQPTLKTTNNNQLNNNNNEGNGNDDDDDDDDNNDNNNTE